MSDETEKLLDAFSARVDRQLDAGKRLRRATDALRKPDTLDSTKAAEKAIAQLESIPWPEEDLVAERDALVSALQRTAKQRAAARRRTALADLQRVAGEAGVAMERLGDDPPAVLLAPITAIFDFDAGQADLTYAREPVLQTRLEPADILGGREEAMGRIRGRAVESAAFFALLSRAYRMACAGQGLAPGERVDLVDLLWPLALLTTEPKALRAPSGRAVQPYPRYLLAYQLQRLRKEGGLVQNGVRIDLGAATGGSTRNKRNVIFVPHSPSDGQYYLSLRLTGQTK